MTDQASDRPRRWMRIALFGSLAVNLAVVGLVVGAVVKGPPEDDKHFQMPPDTAVPYARAFEGDEKRALRRALRGAYAGLRPDPAGPLQGYRDAIDVLRSEPFDAGALSEVLEGQNAQTEARRRLGQEALVSVLADLSPEARLAYAARLEAEIDALVERWSRRRFDGEGRDGGRDRDGGKGRDH